MSISIFELIGLDGRWSAGSLCQARRPSRTIRNPSRARSSLFSLPELLERDEDRGCCSFFLFSWLMVLGLNCSWFWWCTLCICSPLWPAAGTLFGHWSGVWFEGSCYSLSVLEVGTERNILFWGKGETWAAIITTCIHTRRHKAQGARQASTFLSSFKMKKSETQYSLEEIRYYFLGPWRF